MKRPFLALAGAVCLAGLLVPSSLRAWVQQPPADKAEALLGQMTLDEKIGQMVQADLMALKDRGDIARYFLGSVLCGGGSDPSPENTPEVWARANDECQAQSQHTRLKIPLIFGVDAVHGHNNVQGAVIFPHNINLGATRNAQLVRDAAAASAQEVVGTGIRWAFAPCVAVAQNERWGRYYESFSEDPAVVAELGAAYVKGLQGDALSASPGSVLACVKHFVGDGGTTNGKDQGNTEVDEATLRATHLRPYIDAIKAGAGSIMVSYSSWNGQKLHGHKTLVTDVLKGELGFDGLVVSDWAGIDQLDRNFQNCIERSVNAGLDMIMIPNGQGQRNNYVDFITGLKQLVAEGKVKQERIDDAVRRILKVKARMGLLDHAPTPTDPGAMAAIGSAEHRAVARECVRQSLVLLKNDGNVLPLNPAFKNIAVVGPAANDLGVQCGGWTIDWQGKPGDVTRGGTTILKALQEAAPRGTTIHYAADGKLQGVPADAVIVVIGERPYAEMFGDRADLTLNDVDKALVAAARKSGKPVVTLLLSGRPLIVGDALADSNAFVSAFLPGTEGGGVADLLLGKAPFRGKLPCVWPRSMDQVPIGVNDTSHGEPLFPLGHGLTTQAR